LSVQGGFVEADPFHAFWDGRGNSFSDPSAAEIASSNRAQSLCADPVFSQGADAFLKPVAWLFTRNGRGLTAGHDMSCPYNCDTAKIHWHPLKFDE
jgi:hypothetical protein